MNSTQARQRLADLTAEVAQASAEVDDTREALAEGEATAGDVSKAQKNLARLQERQENARAASRVSDRREAVEQAHIQAESERIKRELRQIALAKRTAELEKWGAFLGATLDQATEFDARLRGLRDQIKDLDAGQFPSRWSSWPLLGKFVSDQLIHTPTTHHSQEA